MPSLRHDEVSYIYIYISILLTFSHKIHNLIKFIYAIFFSYAFFLHTDSFTYTTFPFMRITIDSTDSTAPWH